MSHFTVLAVGNNPGEMLAPFQENNMGNCPKEYLKFNDMEDEYKEEWKNKTTKAIFVDGKYYLSYDERFRVKGSEGILSIDSFAVPEGLKEEDVPLNKIYKSFKEFVEKWHGYKARDEQKKRYGYWENPNAKWDWYQIGGRWAGFFKLKNGKEGVLGSKSWCNKDKEIDKNRADQAFKKDIDFEGMLSDNFEKNSKIYDDFEEMMKSDPKKAKQEAYWSFGIENKGDKDNFIPETREEYIKRTSFPSTFAVLKDGKWYEKGEMGWWAMVSNEKDPSEWHKEFQKLLKDLPDDTLLTIVDCHI